MARMIDMAGTSPDVASRPGAAAGSRRAERTLRNAEEYDSPVRRARSRTTRLKSLRSVIGLRSREQASLSDAAAGGRPDQPTSRIYSPPPSRAPQLRNGEEGQARGTLKPQPRVDRRRP